MKQLLILLLTGVCLGLVAQETESTDMGYRNVLGLAINLTTPKNTTLPDLVPGTHLRYSRTETKNRGYNFAPYIGRQLSKNWLVGFVGRYAHSKTETTAFDDSYLALLPLTPDIYIISRAELKSYNYSIFARYTFITDKLLSMYLEPRVGRSVHIRENLFLASIHDPETISSTSGSKVIELNIIPGLSYQISKRFNFLLSLDILSYQLGKETYGAYEQSGWLESFDFSNPGIQTAENRNTVSELSTNFRPSSVAFSFEFRF